jgi:beta-xylosidase
MTGLVVMGEDYAALMVTCGANGFDVKRITCGDAAQGNPEIVDATASGLKNPIWLRVSVEPEAMCIFSYSSNGKEFTVLGSPFSARAGRWIGAKVGLVCIGNGGHADFDWFRVE